MQFKSRLSILVAASVLYACGGPELDGQDPPLEGPPAAVDNSPPAELRVVILGNSLAAGYGVAPDEAFPALVGQKAMDRGWPVRIINAGISGETTSGGVGRIEWLLRERVDILVLELGANDGLRGILPTVTRTNLATIIARTRARYPDAAVILAGMQVPPNLGPAHTESFRGIFPEIARKMNTHLIPFLLEGVGGEAELNQADGIHPNREGHKIIAETVWHTLAPIIASRIEKVTDQLSTPTPQPDT